MPEKENPSRIVVQKKILDTADVAEQLPEVHIPYDHEVVILALSDNSGTIYIGNNKISAEDASLSYPLSAGEAIGYKISNVGHLWIRASTADDAILWTTEAEEGAAGLY